MDFKFKQFSVKQQKSAMKIGTDAVLLGAWTSLENMPFSILDIGTGTGVIALQLAQRSNADTIDAIEIEANAYEEAVTNFENSDWSDRLFCYHCSLAEFTQEIEEKYDLIISNPPFYTADFHSNNKQRTNARSTSSLSFEDLLLSVSKLLSTNGTFSVIIPFSEEANFINIANLNNLFLQRITHVKGNVHSKIKRSLLAFSFSEKTIEKSELIIEIERHRYTKEYLDLVKDFYLNL